MEILHAISTEYGRPGFRPVVQESIELEKNLLEAFSGKFFLQGDAGSSREILHIYQDGAILRADVPPVGWKDIELRAAKESTFFFSRKFRRIHN